MALRTGSCRRSSGAAALAVVALVACGAAERPPYAGFVDAPIARIASPVSGQIASIEVREGDRVPRGALLARLDDREPRARVVEGEAALQRAASALEEAERNAASAEPALAAAQAEIESARAAEERAVADLRRTDELAQAGVQSPAELDAARAAAGVASATTRERVAQRRTTHDRAAAAIAAVHTARATVEQARAALDLARVQLERTEIRSPVDGVVADVELRPGEWATAGTPVVAVEDLGHQWVRIDVGESELAPLRLGAPASIRAVAFPGRSWHGRVVEIGAEGEFAMDEDVRRGRPDVRTFRVRVALDPPAPELRPGMSAEVTIPTAEGAR